MSAAARRRGDRQRAPWLLACRGLGPACGSGPPATVLQDILGILVHFFVRRASGT